MTSLEAELERARTLSVETLADAIASIGFECTRCGACCKAASCGETGDRDDHTATVFPDEIRQLQAQGTYDWRDVARPTPYGLSDGPEGPEGETFEWALQTDGCGDCVFYRESEGRDDVSGRCTVYGDRPLVCRTYPFSVVLSGTSQPLGEAIEREGPVRAHECEGLGREIDREEAEALAVTLKRRAVRELEEAIAVRDRYESTSPGPGEVVVHDSEGPKGPDGTPL